MDQATLVDMQIEDGRRIFERLVGEGVPVTAAAWVKESESGWWYLYLVTPLVVKDGAKRPAYRRVNAVLQQMPQSVWVEPLEIKAVGPDSPVGTAVLDVCRQYPGASLIPYRGTRLGDLSIVGAYVYPPVSTPIARADT